MEKLVQIIQQNKVHSRLSQPPTSGFKHTLISRLLLPGISCPEGLCPDNPQIKAHSIPLPQEGGWRVFEGTRTNTKANESNSAAKLTSKRGSFHPIISSL